jgi:hypothetical protein
LISDCDSFGHSVFDSGDDVDNAISNACSVKAEGLCEIIATFNHLDGKPISLKN